MVWVVELCAVRLYRFSCKVEEGHHLHLKWQFRGCIRCPALPFCVDYAIRTSVTGDSAVVEAVVADCLHADPLAKRFSALGHLASLSQLIGTSPATYCVYRCGRVVVCSEWLKEAFITHATSTYTL